MFMRDATVKVRLTLAAILLGGVHSAPSPLRGIGDYTLYEAASSRLVGVLPFTSFSSARFANDSVVGHGLPGPEAMCHCSCYAEGNFAYCYNTAKTTVGVATYWFDPFTWQWESRALRYFGPNLVSRENAPRVATNFLARAVLPDGPGGRMVFDSTYTSDVDAAAAAGMAARGVEVVRAAADGVSCSAHGLCDVQCAGVAQYTAWRARCDAGTAALDAWSDPAPGSAATFGGSAALAWFVAGAACAVAAITCWRRRAEARDVSQSLPPSDSAIDSHLAYGLPGRGRAEVDAEL